MNESVASNRIELTSPRISQSDRSRSSSSSASEAKNHSRCLVSRMRAIRACAGIDTEAAGQREVDALQVGLRGKCDPRALGRLGRDAVHVRLQLVHSGNGAGMDDVGHADPDGVALGFVGEVAHEDPLDGRSPAGGSRVVAPDDVRVHPEAADVLADPVDDQDVERGQREPGEVAVGLVPELPLRAPDAAAGTASIRRGARSPFSRRAMPNGIGAWASVNAATRG